MAELTKSWGVKPELEVFDLGHIRLAKQLIEEGLIKEPPMFQICLGIPWGADQSVDTMKAMKDHLHQTQLGLGLVFQECKYQWLLQRNYGRKCTCWLRR